MKNSLLVLGWKRTNHEERTCCTIRQLLAVQFIALLLA